VSRFLFAWELGAHYGHLARLLPIAEGLRARGHDVVFALRDTRSAAELLAPRGFAFVQAPLAGRRGGPGKPPASYAEILLADGWSDPAGLLGRVLAWQALMRAGRTDVVLADHAPTTLLAAHLAGLPHLAIGNGFAIPPDCSPPPSIRPWEPVGEARLREAAERVDAAIMGVAARLGVPERGGLRDLFGPDDLLDTFAELDHYGARESARYIGPIFALAGARRVAWQSSHGRRILAYLRPDVPGVAALVAALGDSGAETLCVIPGLGPAQARRLAGPRLRIALRPVAFGPLLDTADLVVAHGGGGTTAEALLSATPMLLVPGNVEQALGAARVGALGAGIVAGAERTREAFSRSLAALLDDGRHGAAARRFADRHAGFTPQRAAARAVAALEARAAVPRRAERAAACG
jgi:UDP:flavonoid glycosyltransferase YjiC (YdhE family)